METALSILTIMPETKEQLAVYVANLKSEILAGNDNPLRIAKMLKVMEETIETLRKDDEIKSMILKEASKYGEKTIKAYGAEFQIKETGTKYYFTVCDDEEWESLKKEQEKISEKIKARETLLKAIKPDVEMYNQNGIRINPPSKSSTTSVTVTLK